MDMAYFDGIIDYWKNRAAQYEEKLRQPEIYRKPGILLSALFRSSYESLIARYSRGEPVAPLAASFPAIVDAWERYLRDGSAEPTSFDSIDDYVTSLWLVSLAVLLAVDDALFARLLTCIGNEGKDSLFERLVATRVSGRPAADKLLRPRSYEPLYQAIDAAEAERSKLMQKFLRGWYKGLRPCYWYENHKGPQGGGFFGYWCIEAAGVAKAFRFDDAPFRDMPYYPRDLVQG